VLNLANAGRSSYAGKFFAKLETPENAEKTPTSAISAI